MPGPYHLVWVYATWADVGGCDVFHSWTWNDRGQWYAVWHSPRPKALWWSTRRNQWRWVGWAFYVNEGVRDAALTEWERQYRYP